MKSLLVLALTCFGSMVFATEDSRYYEIKRIHIREVQDLERSAAIDQVIDNLTKGCQPGQQSSTSVIDPIEQPTDPTNPIDLIDVIVEQIINIGKKIWAIVQAGQPVVNAKGDSANALPSGVKCWNELEGWQTPQSRLYQVQYENGFGKIVVDYTFRVSFIHGGSYRGRGRYVTLASIHPAQINVSWGFKLDAAATVPMVINQGSKTDPVAGLQLVMDWQVESPFKTIRSSESFFVNGVGQFQKLN